MKDKTMGLLEKYLDNGFRISPMAPDKSTIHNINKIEKILGINFPEEYIAHLLGEGAEVLGERGLYIEVKEEIWPRAKAYDIGPFWSFLYGIHTFTASKESENWMRLEIAGKKFIEETGIKAIPILKIIGDANIYCVNENGKIVQYIHDENTIEEREMNFWELFEKELKELRERKDMKIKENNGVCPHCT
jgi:hypothetical protein